MTIVAIGALRHRVVLEEAVRTPDGGGGADETWQAIAELWASVRPIGGSERIAADATSGALTHDVVIRHRAGVVPAMRFRFGTRILEIAALRDVDERRRHLRCLCLERDL